MTARDGRVCRLENVFLRGGNIKFIVLPEALKSSPILKKVQVLKAKKLESEGGKGGGAKTGGMGTNAKKQKKA
jgi:small nuclear ribonucleoprotein D3